MNAKRTSAKECKRETLWQEFRRPVIIRRAVDVMEVGVDVVREMFGSTVARVNKFCENDALATAAVHVLSELFPVGFGFLPEISERKRKFFIN